MIGRNNPLNIRFSPLNKWVGQSGQSCGFCNFRSVDYCIRAAVKILISYRKRGLDSYSKIISTWAPSTENDTRSYEFYITDKCKVFPWDIPNTIEDFATLIYYMWCFEQGKSPSLSIADIELLLDKFKYLNCYDEKS